MSAAALAIDDHSLEVCKTRLITEVLRSNGTVRIKVLGTSMLPTIWPGDVVVVDSNCESLVCDDIVMVQRNGRLFVHRLIARTSMQDGWRAITRGDAMPQTDPPAASDDVLGKVLAIERGMRIHHPKRRRSVAGRIVSWTLCNSDVLRSLAVRLHSSRYHDTESGRVQPCSDARMQPTAQVVGIE